MQQKLLKFIVFLWSYLSQGLTDLVAASEDKLQVLQQEIQRKQKVLRDSLESKRKAEAKAQAKKDADAEQAKAKRM